MRTAKSIRSLPGPAVRLVGNLQDSFIKVREGKDIALFFGDGVPNGGVRRDREIVRILCDARVNPEGNPVTFMSCTNDAAVDG
jgi:hypothetical protein